MKTRFRRSPVLLIAILAGGLVIGARWWSSLAPKTGGGDRSETDAASLESRAPRLSGSLPNPAAPERAKRAVPKRDTLLENLRSKLTAANVVPNEALLTFRSAEARDRFAKQAAAYGLEILDTIPQLNTARVRYGRLEDLRDAIAASSGDFANVEGNLWLSIAGTSSPFPDPNNQGGRAPFGQGWMNAIKRHRRSDAVGR